MSTCPVNRDLQNHLNALDDDDTDAVEARADELLCDITEAKAIELLDEILCETEGYNSLIKWLANQVYINSNAARAKGAEKVVAGLYAIELIKPLLLARAQKEINDERESAMERHYDY